MATQTQEVTQRMAPFQEDFLKKLYDDAQTIGAGRMPYAPQQSFGLSAEQQKAASMAGSGLGSYMPYLQQAQGAMAQAGAFAQPGAAQQFMNPYEDQVVQQTMSDIQKAGQQQQNQFSAQANNAGAFGGSRFAVGQAALGEANLQEQSRAAANIRQQGYSQAQQAAQNAAQLQSQQAGMYGTLGGQAQQMGVQDINTLLGIGGLTQQMGQQGLDFARQNALQQQSEPFQRLGFLSDLFRGVPSAQQTTTQTAPSANVGSQLMGLGIAGLSAYGQFGG